MAGRKEWLENLLKPYTERADRRTVERFAAYRWDGHKLKQEAVRDISSTGVYIVTEERWPVGTVVFLIMQREGPLQMNPEHRIQARAKVARCGEDGMGLAFVWEDDPKSQQWESLRESLIEQVKPRDMLSLLRIAEAVTFLSLICPGGAGIVGQLLRGRLSNHKLANAVTIALKAEKLLAPVSDKLRADPNMVVRILEDGSCTDEDWLRHYWCGLLATCCSAGGKDQSSRVVVELFSQLTTFPVRILTVVCTRATKVITESGAISAKPLACELEELRRTTGSRGSQIERDLERLAELRLIENKGSHSTALEGGDEACVVPTGLGLELFARCNGHRGPLRSFYAPCSQAPA